MKNIVIYCISAIFLLIPVSAVRPMTSLFANDLKASMVEIGFIVACYSITPLFIAIRAGRFVDRIGEKLPLMVGSIGMTIAVVLPYFFPYLFMLYISQLILGGSQLLALVALQNGVGRSVPIEKRDKAIGTFSLCVSFAMMLGPLIGGYSVEHNSFSISYLLISFFSIVPLILSLFIISSRSEGEKEPAAKGFNNVLDLLIIPGLKRSIIVSMIILAGLDIFYVYYPLFATSIGLSPLQIGWILTIQAFASIITRLFMPFLVSKFGRVKVLYVFMFFGAIAYASIAFFEHFVIIALLTVILGFGLGITQPLTTIISYNLAPKGHTGEVLGLRLAGNRLSQVIIPLLFAGLSNFIGLGFIFIIKAIALGGGAILAKGIQEKEDEVQNEYRVNCSIKSK
ncbi:MFS transporter [Alkalihalobacillus sp. BA299]|uniref:MFS transporter n=1 Tax=Alkalihalobacillus sp. BA299 TaxID=2815938 RepID=UPI001ADA0F9D|nr:MFS transporter [Alkalihalobacillus sp. BA299]